MPIHNYHRPADWDSALDVLRRAQPLLLGPRVPIPPYGAAEALADLSRLELAYLKADTHIHIGALTALQTLVEAPDVGGLLNEAARLTAHYGLRNVATLGGLLLAKEGPVEILLALLALDAAVIVRGSLTHESPITNYSLSAGEMIVEVKFALPATSAKAAIERVTRTPRDEGIVTAVALIEVANGVCSKARLALAGASPRPMRATSAEKLLEGQPLTSEQIQKAEQAVMNEAKPLGDYRGSADYRKAMAGVLTKRALEKAAQ